MKNTQILPMNTQIATETEENKRDHIGQIQERDLTQSYAKKGVDSG